MQNDFRAPRYKRYVPVLAFLLVAMACGGQAYNPAVTPAQMISEPMTSQVLSPGDVVEIKFLYTAELNDTQRIRPDGTIDLQMIGKVKLKERVLRACSRN